MDLSDIFNRFAQQCPVPVMVTATIANVFSDQSLDQIFRDHALQQREKDLPFSSVAKLMGMVVTRTHKSVNSAYTAQKEQFDVAIKSVYNKLNGVEPCVSAAVVRNTGQKMRDMIEQMDAIMPSPLPGYRVKILDGNHFAATEKRLQEMRTRRGSPLPGKALVVLDPQYRLMTEVYPSEDGDEQERSILQQIVEDLQPGDVWIADRNFCTAMFLHEIALNQSFFIIRQHATSAPWTACCERHRIGVIDTGEVFGQNGVITDSEGVELKVRRITIVLHQPTEDGDTQIHLYTNLPENVSASEIASAYRQRWSIEAAFNELTLSLRCEINTLGYPKASLFAFCIAVSIFNVLSVMRAALRAAHGCEEVEENLSIYYVADEIAGVSRGMTAILPPCYWRERFGDLSVVEMVKILLPLAAVVDMRRFQKSKRGPKKPPPKRTRGKAGHYATARVLGSAKGL
jgi:hypothetical protein